MSLISFTSLALSYSTVIGATIDTSTTSTNSGCIVDSTSFQLSPSVSGIGMASNGIITVSTTSAIALTSLIVSMTTNNGAEIHTSSAFSMVVEDCLLASSIPSISD